LSRRDTRRRRAGRRSRRGGWRAAHRGCGRCPPSGRGRRRTFGFGGATRRWRCTRRCRTSTSTLSSEASSCQSGRVGRRRPGCGDQSRSPAPRSTAPRLRSDGAAPGGRPIG